MTGSSSLFPPAWEEEVEGVFGGRRGGINMLTEEAEEEQEEDEEASVLSRKLEGHVQISKAVSG